MQNSDDTIDTNGTTGPDTPTPITRDPLAPLSHDLAFAPKYIQRDPQDAELPNVHGTPPRYRMVVAYDGTFFHGWQKQKKKDGRWLRTVQDVVEYVIRRAVWQNVRLVGASRTDAGVHARGQVASFDCQTRIPVERMAMAFNARLPEDIEVLHVEPADGFSCISDVVNKQYRYRIWNSPRKPLDHRYVVYHCFDKPLDLDLMREAAAKVVGEHDFVSFAQAGHGRACTVRNVYKCDVEEHGREVHLVVHGDGFLYNQVRIMAGTLVDIGRGRLNVSCIDEAFVTGNRRLVGPTLPPNGLCLEWIQYNDGFCSKIEDDSFRNVKV